MYFSIKKIRGGEYKKKLNGQLETIKQIMHTQTVISKRSCQNYLHRELKL